MSDGNACAGEKVRSGKDLSDPDVSGWGVVAAFSTSAFFTVTAIILAYLFRALPPDLYNKVDDMFLDIVGHLVMSAPVVSYPFRLSHAAFSYLRSFITRVKSLAFRAREQGAGDKTKQEPPSVLDRRSSAFASFLLAMSEQQLVTGMAILLTATLVVSGTLGGLYESMTVAAYSIAVSLAFLSYLIHLCTITTLRSYFDTNPRLRNIRLVFMTVFLAILIPNTVYAQSASFWNRFELPFYAGDPSGFNFYVILNQALLLYIVVGGYIRRTYELYFPNSRGSSAVWPIRIAYWIVKRHHLHAWNRVMDRRWMQEALAVLDGKNTTALSRKGIRARHIMFRVVNDEISKSFLWEITWLLFYSTFGFASFFFNVKGNWEMVSSAPANFGQLMPVLLLLLPCLGFLEGWSTPARDKAALQAKAVPSSKSAERDAVEIVATPGPSPDPEAQGGGPLFVPIGAPIRGDGTGDDPRNDIELLPYPTGYGFTTVKSIADRAKEVLPERSEEELQRATKLDVFDQTFSWYPRTVNVYALALMIFWFLVLQGWALISSSVLEEEIFHHVGTDLDWLKYNLLVSILCFYLPLFLLNAPVFGDVVLFISLFVLVIREDRQLKKK
ncbi:hypothetical protein B0T16DRAFT_393635 [Cercophora newfieldiana]|uniref:Uncharacterized protein n=1 Tax=Cercophora newfieldiana TaxID=92897 RepID=A0AA39XXD6_9PEZI|nr:hypothetical protein B0T16DRAFT_393635 [Cercophora newfieldiana]